MGIQLEASEGETKQGQLSYNYQQNLLENTQIISDNCNTRKLNYSRK